MTPIGHVWATLIGSLAMIALIPSAFGLMLGFVKPAEALQPVAAILGIVILLMLIPSVVADFLLSISARQWIGLAIIGGAMAGTPRTVPKATSYPTPAR